MFGSRGVLEAVVVGVPDGALQTHVAHHQAAVGVVVVRVVAERPRHRARQRHLKTVVAAVTRSVRSSTL